MSQHTPWSQEEAEKWAKQFWLSFNGDERVDPGVGETYRGWMATHQAAFLAGLAKAAEFIAKSPTEREFVKVIEDWKHAWMNIKGTDEADASNARSESTPT